MYPPQHGSPGAPPPGQHPQPHAQPYGQQAPQAPQAQPPGGGFQSAAAKKRARRAEGGGGGGGGTFELIVDKAIDFALIFVGLYAATALQRCQDTADEKEEYVALLKDFKRELAANVEQEASIERDLGSIEETEPGKNLGPMQETFHHFFEELAEDEKVVACMHDEFVAKHKEGDEPPKECHDLYKQFDKGHAGHSEGNSFTFKPAVLTPFYRREVWQLYLADGVKTFRNKELAVNIAEVYANADLIEEQIQDIETTYNDAFMSQVGRTKATDMELAEIVHDEETQHELSEADMTLLLHVDEAIKNEHYASLEVEHALELKVERMKKTVLLMREEIEAVQTALDEELDRQGAEDEAEESE